MKDRGVAESARWTRPEDYIQAMARKRSSRRSSRARLRSEPESPRLMMSTLPFLLLILFLALMTVAITIAAFPGWQPAPRAPRAVAHQEGVAAKGWFDEAQKDFHR